MMLLLLSKTNVKSFPGPRPKSRVKQQFRCGFGLPGRFAMVAGKMCKGCRGDVQGLPGGCAKVAGEMCKGAKVKSTPSPRPKTGV